MKYFSVKSFLWIPLLFVAALFYACSDSLDITFDESETRFISIDAYFTNSFEANAEKKKQDTIAPGDSIIFLSRITPSKSIRLQRYYWTIDNQLLANEFSFKGTIFTPGIHTISFVLIDFFGDTLTDNLQLYVATPPALNSSMAIPQNGTQGILPTDYLNFAWSQKNDDDLWLVNYRFILSKNFDGEVLADTLLSNPNFTYSKGFDALEKYTWTVQAVNELGLTSKQVLKNSFYTTGTKDECAITGNLKTSSIAPSREFDLEFLDSANNVIRSIKKLKVDEDGNFSVKPLPPGNVSLTVKQDAYPDFTPVTLQLNLLPQSVLELQDITLRDSEKPFFAGMLDTLDIMDTLKFIVRDGGGPLKASRISAVLETTTITNLWLESDTLFIVPPSLENSWTYKPLTVTVLDLSNNAISKSSYIRPKHTFAEVLNE